MASSSTTTVKSVNKYTMVNYAFTFDSSGSAPSTVFQIPPDVDVVSLQVGSTGATLQTIGIQGSNDGVNFATIASATRESVNGSSAVAVFARNSGTGMIGKFPYYRLNNATATATVSASLSFTKA